MDVLDSRRLTGPGLLLDRPGAVLELRLGGQDPDRAIAAWESAARRLLRDVGWADEQLSTRRFPGGVSLALTAPVDGLYAATELNELAWEAAAAELGDGPAPRLRRRPGVAAERDCGGEQSGAGGTPDRGQDSRA